MAKDLGVLHLLCRLAGFFGGSKKFSSVPLIFCGIFSVFSLLMSSAIWADNQQQVLVVSPGVDSVNLSPVVSLYEADESLDTPQQAYRLWQQGQFRSSLFDDQVSTGRVGGARWLAFRLVIEPQETSRWVLSTRDVMHLTRLTLYVPGFSEGKPVYVEQLDSLHALESQPLGTPLSSFFIDKSFDETRPFLIRVEGQLPLSAPLLLQSQSVAQWEAVVRVALSSVLFGAVLGLVLYNFVLYFFVRDTTYLLYVAYASSMLLWLMQISGYMLMLNRELGLFYYDLMTPNMSAGLANFFGSLFTVVFLRLHQQNKWQGVLVMGVSIINLVIGIASYFLSSDPFYVVLHQTQHVIAALSALVIVVPTLVLALKGYRFALPFILAWGSLGTGIILLGLGVQHEFFGVIFPVNFNVLAAMVVEMVLMSFALGLRIQDVQVEANQMAQLSITDGLTGLLNQRHFHKRVREVLSDPKQSGWALAMMDIDHFKRFNDSYGHLLGDKVLKRLAQIIENSIRQQDAAFRVGGEEFGLLLKTDSLEEALKIVERTRVSFLESRISSDSGEVLNCSLSAGVTLMEDSDTAESFIHRADQALYQAKHQGRNRVLTATADLGHAGEGLYSR